MLRSTKLKGFTIIEVVLVLAIASLIFLMVFLALPALQSGQRDSARKNDASAVSSALTSYSSNNNGSLPAAPSVYGNASGTGFTTTSGTTGFVSYLASVGNNIKTVNIKLPTAWPYTATSGEGTIDVYLQSACNAAGVNTGDWVLNKGSSRQYAIVTKLEAGGGVAFCQ